MGKNNVEIDGYEPLLLATKEQFDLYWAQCVPLLDKVIDKAMHGELTTDDIYNSALQGQTYVFVFRNDDSEVPDVKLCLAMDLVNYPKLAALNVVAIGGTQLGPLFNKFWTKLCGWAYINNIRAIEGLMSPAMAKIVTKFGFTQTYTHMRFNLNED
jgi:hypothetical protein